MKMKRIVTLLIACAMLIALSFSAFAEDAKLDYITDAYGLFNRAEMTKFESSARSIADKYSCGIYVIVVGNYKDYSHYDDAYKAACEIYDDYNLGYGDTTNGYMLLLSIEERDYALVATGTARAVFTDRAFSNAEQAMLERLKVDDWRGGVDCFIKGCKELLEASGGLPEYYEEPVNDPGAVPYLIIAGSSAVVALIVCLIFGAQMKTAKEKTTADDYIKTSSIVFSVREDMFINRTVTRTKINTSSNSGGGGGGGGHSGHSGKF